MQLATSIQNWQLKRQYVKECEHNLSSGVVSFSFDDVSNSVISNALPILNANAIKASFYINFNCLSCETDIDQNLSKEELLKLHTEGHEIGGHTFNHFRADDGTAQEFLNEIQLNKSAAKQLGINLEHFAYPQGKVNLAAKKIVNDEYLSARTISPGMNVSNVDLNLLKANQLYSSRNNIEELKSLIVESQKKNAWTIFYSHDVKENPSPYGCTPALLNEVIEIVLAAGLEIATVGSVFNKLKV